jgi:hypothetical protein
VFTPRLIPLVFLISSLQDFVLDLWPFASFIHFRVLWSPAVSTEFGCSCRMLICYRPVGSSGGACGILVNAGLCGNGHGLFSRCDA